MSEFGSSQLPQAVGRKRLPLNIKDLVYLLKLRGGDDDVGCALRSICMKKKVFES